MSTTKPRITISLEPRLYEVVSRLARANGQAMSQVIVDFLQVAEGPMVRAVALLERAAQASDKAREHVAGSLARAERSVVPALLEGLRQIELQLDEAGVDWDDLVQAKERGRAQPGVKPARADAPPPVPVTRGVGHPTSGRQPAKKGRRRA